MLNRDSHRENGVIVNNQPNASPVIAMKVKNLSKVFESSAGKVFALKQVNFTVNKGEFVSIIGPSGSGKSTLLNMIGALDRPTVGKVFIGGVDIFFIKRS